MVSMPSSLTRYSPHLRKLNLVTDLEKVADLVEMCFPIQQDPDGQTYVREMRKASREMRMLGWLSKLAELDGSKAAGFVWEEDGQIVGNLSLIPFQDQGNRFHLIANVAVHPMYRNQGIARALTDRALDYLRRRNEPYVWLQVKADNPGAIHLYREAGFIDRAIRTTWRIKPSEIQPLRSQSERSIKVHARQKNHWLLQKRWLGEAYPSEIRWNLGINFNRFEPGLIQSISNFIDGVHFKHWQVDVDGKCCGFITWQQTTSYANNLWLAFPKGVEDGVVAKGLEVVLRQCAPRHPISIDFPVDRQAYLFEEMGFVNFRTLNWMQQRFK